MICRKEYTKEDYNYKFVENGMVELSRPDLNDPIVLSYEDWYNNYYIVDKWKTL